MTSILIIALAGFAILAGVALVRGLAAFHRDAELLRQGDPAAITNFGKQQNRMMFQRVLFQGLAILVVALIGMVAAG